MTTPTTPEQPEPSALSVPEQIALKAFGISHHAYDTGVMIDKEDVDEIASAIEAHVQRELASTRAASAWINVTDELPPLEVPVWLMLPNVDSPIVGVRTLYDGEWYWGHCYGDFHWSNKSGWHTDTADMDDYKPSHWMRLPEPPAALSRATTQAGEIKA